MTLARMSVRLAGELKLIQRCAGGEKAENLLDLSFTAAGMK
jgi:hypothetical protein